MRKNISGNIKNKIKYRAVTFFEFAGLDIHIIATLVLRAWAVFAGGCTAVLIPLLLSPLQQGYYYTFNAVLSTQMFFELGLNQILVHLTSHAAAKVNGVQRDRSEDDLRWRYALASLDILSSRWNMVISILFFVVVGFGGSWFFYQKGSLPTANWITILVVLIAATAVNIWLAGRLAICEGLGEVGQIARQRFWQSIVGYAIMWLLLVNDAGLWSATALPIINAIGTTWWLSRRRLRQSLAMVGSNSATEIGYTYYRDVFPLQWRMALSWVSGYFIFHFVTPIIFVHRGAVEAGRIGLALTIFSAFSTIGYSWISAKIPTLSAHIARNQRHALDSLFKKLVFRSTLVTVLLSVLFFLAVNQFGFLIPQLVDHLPPMPSLLLLSLNTTANVVIFCLAAYMRAHKEEPLTSMSIVTALLVGTGVWFMSKISLTATVGVFPVVSILVGLPWCMIIFAGYRNRNS